MTDPIRVMIAGGGTGGHLFPGIAIANEFRKRHPKNRIGFVGTGRPFEKNVLKKAGYPHYRISASGLKRVGIRNALFGLLKIPAGLLESIRLLRRCRPHIVIGVGGYSAGPVLMGAYLLNIPTVLHEQNSIPGITNHLLAPFVRRIYVSFPGTRFQSGGHKIRLTGNPVRRDFLSASASRENRDRFTVLIVGGSQGARAINRTLIGALPSFAEAEKHDPLQRFHFIHQTGEADFPWVYEAYEKFGISCRVSPFFHDMALQYGRADLIIARSGATTIAEVTAAGKAAIFIPFPHAADNHQVFNAKGLLDANAAGMILQDRLTPERLAAEMIDLKNHPETLQRMAAQSKSLGRPDAADQIVWDCYRIIRQQR